MLPMKSPRFLPLLSVFCGLTWLVSGCASVDVDPKEPRSDRGYVDLFTEPKIDAWWQVEVFDPQRGSYREFTAQFNSPQFGIFRVAARPGLHKARIRFVNHALESPAEVEVDVKAGRITPIQVTIDEAGSTNVRVVDDRVHPTRRNPVTDYPQALWRIAAVALPPTPYRPKAETSYWK
jgi:hypothetical protein